MNEKPSWVHQTEFRDWFISQKFNPMLIGSFYMAWEAGREYGEKTKNTSVENLLKEKDSNNQYSDHDFRD